MLALLTRRSLMFGRFPSGRSLTTQETEMSVFNFLFDLFGDEEARTEYANNPAAYTAEHLPEGVTGADVLAAIPDVCAALPPEQGDALRSAYGLSDGGEGPSGGSGGGAPTPVDFPPPPAPVPGDDPVESVLRQVNYYTDVVNTTNQTFEDNDVTTIDDRDTFTDASVNQNIEAFGDVNQDFDTNIASGDGAVAQSGDGTANTGDGALVAGDDLDIEDSTVNTGVVGGSVTGDVDRGIVGDGNTALIDTEVDDSALAFGGGDAFNDSQVVEGDGVVQNDIDGDANAANNTGSGDQTVVQDSDLDESAVGGSVQSNDVDIDADGGSSVAFGEGSDSDSGDVDIDDVDGNVQVAGDAATQAASNDESVTVEDSFQDNSTDVEDSFNEVDASINVDASDDDVIDVDDNDGLDVDDSANNNTLDASDDDLVDLG
jgi:hypothetical protein